MVAVVAGSGLANACSAYVDVATGNLILHPFDEPLWGANFDAAVIRLYNSCGLLNDLNGDKACYNREQSLDLSELGTAITRIAEDGSQIRHLAHGSDYRSSGLSGAQDLLSLVADNGQEVWLWQEGSSQLKEYYDRETGDLIAVRDLSGNSISYQRDNKGHIAAINDESSGKFYTLSYYPQGRLESIAMCQDSNDTSLRRLFFDYDIKGRLHVVTLDLSPGDNCTEEGLTLLTVYEYESETSSRITSVARYRDSEIAETLLNISYDDQGRVETVSDGNCTSIYDYSVPNATSVVNAKGEAWIYIFDANHRLIRSEPSFAR